MANFAYADLDITTTTLEDAVNDSKFGQIQALTFTVNPSNGTVALSTTGTNLDIFDSTRPGFLTGRRPVKGQLYPRGVYNK
tara:strand:+ start:1994 stop:2236 length:243 start_codon:yes stop_codon:yes gene_type:complete